MSTTGNRIFSDQDKLQEFVLLSPEGQHLTVSREVFEGFSQFLKGAKPNGNLAIHFARGGIAGVVVTYAIK